MSGLVDPYRRNGRLEGQCLCGAVSVVVDGDHVAAVGICHCDMCQRWNGGVFGLFSATADAVTSTGPVGTYSSSSFSERSFCKTCGSHLWMRDTVEPDADFELVPGIFPAAREFPLISEIYTDVAPAYAVLKDGHVTATRAEYEAKNRFVPSEGA